MIFYSCLGVNMKIYLFQSESSQDKKQCASIEFSNRSQNFIHFYLALILGTPLQCWMIELYTIMYNSEILLNFCKLTLPHVKPHCTFSWISINSNNGYVSMPTNKTSGFLKYFAYTSTASLQSDVPYESDMSSGIRSFLG